jgi:hypothetical protein
MGLIGANEAGPAGLDLQTIKYTKAATGTVIAAVTGKRIYVYSLKQIVDAALSTKWRSGGATDLEENQAIVSGGGYVEAVTPPAWLFRTVSGESLDLVITGTGNAAGRLSYWVA